MCIRDRDPSDEPAEALLERIREEKQRLIKEGKIKKDKHESVIFRRDNSHYEKLDGVERCIDDELPFEIPENWCWCKIGTIFTLQAGKNIQAAEIHATPFANSYPCYGGNGIRGYVASSNRTGDYPIIGRQGALCGNINRAIGEFYAKMCIRDRLEAGFEVLIVCLTDDIFQEGLLLHSHKRHFPALFVDALQVAVDCPQT